MPEPTVTNPTFLALLSAHSAMMGLFEEHQQALLERDFGRALERLLELRRQFEDHVQGEEELFAKLFSEVDSVRGTPLDLFTGEHKHLRELLGEFENATRRLDAGTAGRHLIELIEEEALFKSFFRHHDERERNLLYPAFDKGTSDETRRDLLRRFHAH
ncbi:MAG: hemerythrin domain-containing protein [Planctomycetes bacterium]|nr:hemerythrin domain-containing protein [Planctomycetota bacterium]